ncbi:MAG: hypothetical protein N3A53_06060 [Verrucomicrobiae bacterium]|nr:hypothetical protein [Verrucomicrobiae bacterium]
MKRARGWSVAMERNPLLALGWRVAALAVLVVALAAGGLMCRWTVWA